MNYLRFMIWQVTKNKVDSTIEITSGTNYNLWMIAGGEGVARVRLVMDLDKVSKLVTAILLPIRFGAYHDGFWGELLGYTILDGEHINPKYAKV